MGRVTFDWSEYLIVAADLSAGREPTASEQARGRAAVSRAYYAAFCPARDFLVDRGELSPARADEPRLHATVMERFRLSTDGRRRKIGNWLRDMRDARNRCDYEAEVPNLAGLVTATLRDARWALEHLAKLQGT